MKLKYVILACAAGEQPVIFPSTSDGLIHKEVAWTAGVAVSAGFCDYGPNGWRCYGRSESLWLDSRPEADQKLLNRYFPIFGEPLSNDVLMEAAVELQGILDGRYDGFYDQVTADLTATVDEFRAECIKTVSAYVKIVTELNERGVSFKLKEWDFATR